MGIRPLIDGGIAETQAFETGFLIFVPFLIIDMMVASVLTAMGIMMMLPPVIIALPLKIIFFVLVNGRFMVVGSLVRSFGGRGKSRLYNHRDPIDSRRRLGYHPRRSKPGGQRSGRGEGW